MSMSDPIADMLTRIRNGGMARRKRVDMPASKMKLEIARILLKEKFIGSYKFIDDGNWAEDPERDLPWINAPGQMRPAVGLRMTMSVGLSASETCFSSQRRNAGPLSPVSEFR